MAKLKSANIGIPHSERYFIVPESGVIVGYGLPYHKIVAAVRDHYIGNGYDTEGLEDKIQEQICKRIDPKFCTSSEGYVPSPNAEDVLKFANFLLTWSMDSFTFVTQEEAERRAEICSKCLHNRMSAGCRVCGWMGKVSEAVGTFLGKRKTVKDPFLNSCAICKCPCRAIVHIPLQHLRLDKSQERMYKEVNCWKTDDRPLP